MKTEEELRQALDFVADAWPHHTADSEARRHIWRLMHQLAEARYQPALDLFASYMNDPDWAWRHEALQAVGFHFALAPDHPITEKIRQMLLTDPDPFGFVRLSAASILGLRSQWPDYALLEALDHDPDRDVRIAALASLLRLADVSDHIIGEVMLPIEAGTADPSRDALVQALAQAGISQPSL
jgi:HEAT repeat protein